MNVLLHWMLRLFGWPVWTACLGLAGSLIAASTEGTVTLEFSPLPTGGKFAPRHVLAVWVTDANTNFVKTLCRYGTKRVKYLTAWKEARGSEAAVDGITGATRSSHGQVAVTWDCRDAEKKLVSDGTYLLFVELADSHRRSYKAVFAIEKGASAQKKSPPDEPYLKSIQVSFQPQKR